MERIGLLKTDSVADIIKRANGLANETSYRGGMTRDLRRIVLSANTIESIQRQLEDVKKIVEHLKANQSLNHLL